MGQNVGVIVDPLCTSNQMLAVKNHCGDSSDTLLGPEFFFCANLVSKTLIDQNSVGFCAVEADFRRNGGEYIGVGQIATMGEVRDK